MKDELIVLCKEAGDAELVSAVEESLSEVGIYGGRTDAATAGELLEALSRAVKRSNLIITLIEREEFIRSKKIVAKSLGLELTQNEDVSEKMGRLANDKKYLYHDSFPSGAVALDSPDSLYSGYYLKSGSICIVFVPIDRTRAPYILEQTGIRIKLLTNCENTARFIGVSKQKLNDFIMDCDNVARVEITEDMSDVVLKFETSGTTEEKARKNGERILKELKAHFGNAMYGSDERSLVNRIIKSLVKQGKTLAITDGENAKHIVSYLAGEKNSSDVCKVIRLSSASESVRDRSELSSLVGRVREKSGFDYAVGLGGEVQDEETGKTCIYCAYANSEGVLTKRIWKRENEEDGVFRIRCSRELMLLVYGDFRGELNYSSDGEKKAPAIAKESEEEENADNANNADSTENGEDGVEERKNKVAPKLDSKTTRNMALIMLAVAVVIVIVAILICREPAENNADANAATTTAATTEVLEQSTASEELTTENVEITEEATEA